jgi:signal transduction histidine kinase
MDTFASEPVALSLTGDVHCLAQLDPMRCKVVLANVIGNAVKYRDPRKAQPYVKIHITARPADFTISIADNGIGIAREHLDKVFDMFFRATDNLEGTGLGLFIVKETVEKLGGKLHVTSDLGAGTTFEITLPR